MIRAKQAYYAQIRQKLNNGASNLGDDVDEVEDLAEEELEGPDLVLDRVPHPVLHVVRQLLDLRLRR